MLNSCMIDPATLTTEKLLFVSRLSVIEFTRMRYVFPN